MWYASTVARSPGVSAAPHQSVASESRPWVKVRAGKLAVGSSRAPWLGAVRVVGERCPIEVDFARGRSGPLRPRRGIGPGVAHPSQGSDREPDGAGRVVRAGESPPSSMARHRGPRREAEL